MSDIDKILQLSLTWHTGVAVLMFPVYSYFEKKTETFFGVGEKFDGGFDNIKRSIVEALSAKLRPIFDKQPIQVQIGESTYREKDGNPVDGEAYRTAVTQFVGTKIEHIASYLIVKQYCEKHLAWIERILLATYSLFAVSVVSLTMAILQKNEIIALSAKYFLVGLGVSAILVVALFVCEFFRHYHRREAHRVVAKYEIL
jgi:hypothetical protein